MCAQRSSPLAEEKRLHSSILFGWTFVNIAACGLLWYTLRVDRPTSIPSLAADVQPALRHGQLSSGPSKAVTSATSTADYFEISEILEKERHEVGQSRAEYLKRKNRERTAIESYGYIFQALPNLGPAERRRLSDLLVEWLAVADDTRASAAAQGISPTSDAYAKIADMTFSEINKKMEAFCAEFPGVRDYLPSSKLNVSLIDAKLGSACAFAGEPLTVEQRIQLAKVWRDRPHAPDERAAMERGEVPDFDAFVEKATPYLSDRQAEILRDRRQVEKAFQARLLSRVRQSPSKR